MFQFRSLAGFRISSEYNEIYIAGDNAFVPLMKH